MKLLTLCDSDPMFLAAASFNKSFFATSLITLCLVMRTF